MDLISIIVPVYNTSAYLTKCIESLIKQTYSNIEIIIIDDGSTDNSLEIAKKYEREDRRIKVLQKENGGLSSARNFGILNSSGSLLGFVDSDDFIDKSMFEILINLINKNNSDISICGWYIKKQNKDILCDFKTNEISVNGEEAINMLLKHVNFSNFLCNKLFRKSIFDNIRFADGKLLEDVIIMHKLLEKAKNVTIISTPLYYYVQHNNTITEKLNKNINVQAFAAYVERREILLLKHPKLKCRINSNYFTICKENFIIALNSENRNFNFEKSRIKDMRSNIFYLWRDSSIAVRVKITSTIISIFPYIYFKLRANIYGE